MTRRIVSSDMIRDALSRLYDPPGLAATALVAELRAAGVLRPRADVYDTLLEAINQMKPPGQTPLQAPGWRRYRYL